MVGCMFVLATSCGDSGSTSNSDGGGGGGRDAGSGGPPTAFGGISFPFGLFDGSVPDVPLAAAPGTTWYCDPVHGDDSFDGASFAKAKKTLGGALAVVKAGDTILLGGGIYREYPDWSSAPSGAAGAPITIGSYGRGTGAPILDGGVKPSSWTRYTAQGQTTVWQSSTGGTKISSTEPVLGIYVNTGTAEYALREVIHGQVSAYPGESLPPNQTQANIKDKSNNFYFDAGGNTVYADFGGTVGTGDPNSADISLLYDSENSGGGHENLIFLGAGHDYYNFIGLTIRASSWSGVYTESSGHTFDHCDFKFNGGAAALFTFNSSDPASGNDITVTMSRIWMNILQNWPRFNNGNTGGGWPAAIDWCNQSNGLAQGNVVYGNGGEGLTLGNTDRQGHLSMNNLVRHNVIFDNFSVNLYLNNTENGKLEQNFVFQHPRDETQTFDGLFAASPGYAQDYGKRITAVNISLGDEPGSAYDAQGHLSDMTVINNIFAGGNFGLDDYDDGTSGPVHHGLKNCVIANNTWILGNTPIPGESSYGWLHTSDGDASQNSILQNNIFVTSTAGDQFAKVAVGAGPGIDNDYNLYSGPGNWAVLGDTMNFAAWKSAHSTWDQHSLNTDAMLQDPAEFTQTATQKPVYDWSKAALKAGSPALGAGKVQPLVTTDFSGAARAGGAHDIGALAQP